MTNPREIDMKRRDLLLGLSMVGGVALTGTLQAQERKPARIGFIGGGAPGDSAAALAGLRDGLKALGYAEPASLHIETRFADGSMDRIQDLIDDIERTDVQLIVAHAQATLVAVRARRRTPLVYSLSADPVSVNLASDLSKPQHNATGVTLMAAELNAKRVELLGEIIPGIRTVAVLYNPQHGGEDLERSWVEKSAATLSCAASFYPAQNKAELDRALATLEAQPPQALLLLSDGFMVNQREAVMKTASARRIPVVGGWGVFADSGALFTYGPRLSEMARRPASYVDRILRGARAAELPIERPSILELVVNLDTAAKLGFNLPTGVIARADRVVG
jgi:putative ABC transport system substrate-binding protein